MAYLFDLFGPLQPRAFSLASNPTVGSEGTTVMGRPLPPPGTSSPGRPLPSFFLSLNQTQGLVLHDLCSRHTPWSRLQCHPGELHLAVAVIEYETRMSTARTGVFTSWLKTLQPASGGAPSLPDFVFSLRGTACASLLALHFARLQRDTGVMTSWPAGEGAALKKEA